jgi:hypothetical protein
MTPSIWVSVASAVVAVALGTGGCTPPRGCTAIGGESGVEVVINAAQRPAPITVEVCIDADCRRASVAGPEGPVFVAHPRVDSEAARSVAVTAFRADGTELVPRTLAQFHPTKKQPNGPGCEPTFYAGTVTVVPG